jgi:hypothetical protein
MATTNDGDFAFYGVDTAHVDLAQAYMELHAANMRGLNTTGVGA